MGVAVDSTHPPCTVRTDNAMKVRFSTTVGEEPEVGLALVKRLRVVACLRT